MKPDPLSLVLFTAVFSALMRRIVPWLSLLLAGCSALDDQTRETRSDSVDQRMLAPSRAAAGEMSASYAMQARQAFRMPLLHDNVDPVLAADTPRRTLPPTTICLRVVVDAQGGVERSEPLLDRPECIAGGDADNADLVAAAVAAVATWRYQPAAICHYPGTAPARAGDCAGAERIEAVPVTLNYAFTFQIERGQVRVQRAGAGAR